MPTSRPRHHLRLEDEALSCFRGHHETGMSFFVFSGSIRIGKDKRTGNFLLSQDGTLVPVRRIENFYSVFDILNERPMPELSVSVQKCKVNTVAPTRTAAKTQVSSNKHFSTVVQREIDNPVLIWCRFFQDLT